VASRELAWHCFRTGSFAEGIKSLATSYKDDDLPVYLRHNGHGHLLPILAELAAAKDEPTKKLGLKVADDAVTWLSGKWPTDPKDEASRKRAQRLLYIVAEVESATQRPERQRAVYEEMVKLFGADDTLLTHIGDWYVTAKRFDEARRVYGQF